MDLVGLAGPARYEAFVSAQPSDDNGRERCSGLYEGRQSELGED